MKVLEEHFEEVIGKKVIIKYSTVNEYFDAVKSFNDGNIKFPIYKSDFLPYIQYEDEYFDHWVGYYSSTPVLKHMIRDLFQKLRSIKIEFLAAIIKQARNHYGELSKSIKNINDQIRQIEKESSIMMHHDAITSTSPRNTLNDYMSKIRSTERKVETLSKNFTYEIMKSSRSQTNNENNLKGTTLVVITNSLPYTRTEIVNFTVSQPYVKLYSGKGEVITKSEVYIEHLNRYQNDRINNNRAYIVAFEITTHPFSQNYVFYKEVQRNDCHNDCVEIANQDPKITTDNDLTIENDHVSVKIGSKQMISEFHDKVIDESIKIPTTFYTYPGNKGSTLSGLYIFNPTHKATERPLSVTERYIQRGKLQTIVHSFYQIGGTRVRVAQSIAINNCRDNILKRSVRVTTKMMTMDYGEYTMRTDLSADFTNDKTTEIFTDNSADCSIRQFYTEEEAKNYNLTKGKPEEYIGLNGYASIHGSAFRSNKDKYFAFANSNSILLHALNRNLYEIMLERNTNYYDDKGITEPLQDRNIETLDQVLYLAKNTDEYHVMRNKISPSLNDKLRVRSTSQKYNSDLDTEDFSILGKSGLTATYNSIDVIDARVVNSTHLNFKLRNKEPYPQTLHSAIEILKYVNSGFSLSSIPEFQLDYTLPAPLTEKRHPYVNTRDMLSNNYEVVIYQNDTGVSIKANDFINIIVSIDSLVNLKGPQNIHITDYATIKPSGISEPVVPIGPEIPTKPKETTPPTETKNSTSPVDSSTNDTGTSPVIPVKSNPPSTNEKPTEPINTKNPTTRPDPTYPTGTNDNNDKDTKEIPNITPRPVTGKILYKKIYPNLDKDGDSDSEENQSSD